MPSHLCGEALEMLKLPCCVHRGAAGNFTSPIRPMGAWLKAMTGVDLGTRGLWPVCYGGNFAAAKRNIERVGRKSWENLRQSLARADNLEEGHYAERAWAGLLSPPLPPAAEEALRSAAANVCREPAAARLHADEDTHCLIGQLVGCECGRKGDPGSSCKHTC